MGLYVSAPAAAHAEGITLAQGTENENAEGGESEADAEGQSDPDAESGASEEEAEGSATEEEGPPWTYQMARISIVLMLIFFAVIGFKYYKLMSSRQKGTV